MALARLLLTDMPNSIYLFNMAAPLVSHGYVSITLRCKLTRISEYITCFDFRYFYPENQNPLPLVDFGHYERRSTTNDPDIKYRVSNHLDNSCSTALSSSKT